MLTLEGFGQFFLWFCLAMALFYLFFYVGLPLLMTLLMLIFTAIFSGGRAIMEAVWDRDLDGKEDE